MQPLSMHTCPRQQAERSSLPAASVSVSVELTLGSFLSHTAISVHKQKVAEKRSNCICCFSGGKDVGCYQAESPSLQAVNGETSVGRALAHTTMGDGRALLSFPQLNGIVGEGRKRQEPASRKQED